MTPRSGFRVGALASGLEGLGFRACVLPSGLRSPLFLVTGRVQSYGTAYTYNQSKKTHGSLQLFRCCEAT